MSCMHSGIYYSLETDNFYCPRCNKGMGVAYYKVAMENRALRNALADSLLWMKGLRASGDSGNWEWDDADAYTTGMRILQSYTKTPESEGE